MQDAKHQQNTTPFLLRLMGPMAALRAAAVVTRHFVYLLDLDDSPATCAVLTPFACPYKAQPSSSCGSQQPVTVEGAAWARELGRDFLPKDLLDSSAYARNKVVVILKQDGIFHSCTLEPKSTAPQSSWQEELGLSFLPVQFVPQQQIKSVDSMKGRKAGKRKAAGRASCHMALHFTNSSLYGSCVLNIVISLLQPFMSARSLSFVTAAMLVWLTITVP